MKITNKSDGDAFAKGLAKRAVATSQEIHTIAQDTVDLKDEAKQSAQAYWMMGWTWDEIESVLEDSEYPKNVINYAIKEAKEYAKKVLNEGPFSVLSIGQEIKLANGSIGRLIEKFADHVIVAVDHLGKVSISADQLDIGATGQLREAYALRVKAATMLYKLSTDQLSHISVENPAANSPMEPVNTALDTALATLASIQQRADEVKREATKLHNKWEANVGKWQPESEEEKDFAQYMYVMLGGEKELDSEIATLFHKKLRAVLGTLYDEIHKGAVLDNVNIITFLTDTFPEIASNIEAHLYEITRHNRSAREYVQQFEKFGKEKADWKKAAVQWAMGAWESTKEFTHLWENSLVPTIENGIQLISEFLMDANKRQVASSIQKALHVI